MLLQAWNLQHVHRRLLRARVNVVFCSGMELGQKEAEQRRLQIPAGMSSPQAAQLRHSRQANHDGIGAHSRVAPAWAPSGSLHRCVIRR